MKPPILSTVVCGRFPSEGALVGKVAERLVELVQTCPTGALALSGGRIARTLFQSVVAESRRRGADWNGWHCFWADERCVPPDHVESNYRVAHEHLLAPLGWVQSQVHRLRGEGEPQHAAAVGQAELSSVVGRGGALDLIFLGMGEDGHVASLFPGEDHGERGQFRDYIAVQGPKPPKHRISLTFSAIERAKRVWVLVNGIDKNEVLRRAMAGDRSLPLGRVLGARASSEVFYQEPFA